MKHIYELLDEIIKNYDEETIAHDNAQEMNKIVCGGRAAGKVYICKNK